jgi:hypothetical protein
MSTGSLSPPQSNKMDVRGLAGSAICTDPMPVIRLAWDSELDLCSSSVQHWFTDNGFHSMPANTKMEVTLWQLCPHSTQLTGAQKLNQNLFRPHRMRTGKQRVALIWRNTERKKALLSKHLLKTRRTCTPLEVSQGVHRCFIVRHMLKGSKKSNNKVFYTQDKSCLLILSQYMNHFMFIIIESMVWNKDLSHHWKRVHGVSLRDQAVCRMKRSTTAILKHGIPIQSSWFS